MAFYSQIEKRHEYLSLRYILREDLGHKAEFLGCTQAAGVALLFLCTGHRALVREEESVVDRPFLLSICTSIVLGSKQL